MGYDGRLAPVREESLSSVQYRVTKSQGHCGLGIVSKQGVPDEDASVLPLVTRTGPSNGEP
jgi:hypothetical protein